MPRPLSSPAPRQLMRALGPPTSGLTPDFRSTRGSTLTGAGATIPVGSPSSSTALPFPRRFVERIACEAAFVGAVFGADGSVLWQGRSVRTATDAQWNALIHRDGGCVICAADPAHCQAHHLDPWTPPSSGSTDIDNLALVCNTDHHLIHDHGHELTRTGREWALKPSGSSSQRGRPPPRRSAA